MVTVYRAHGLRVVIFTDDHEPAHVHVFGVSSGSGRNDTLSAIGANHAAIASRTPKAFITRSSVSSVGLPLSLNAL
jgi:hypothetical protein